MEKFPLFVRKMLANGVHLFTATGAVWGFLTLLAIWDGNYRLAIVYVIASMFVDGFDGMLARWFDVNKYAAWIDGGLLDNIIDYLNYVVVVLVVDQGARFDAARIRDGCCGPHFVDIRFLVFTEGCKDGQPVVFLQGVSLGLEFSCIVYDAVEVESMDQFRHIGGLQYPCVRADQVFVSQPQ